MLSLPTHALLCAPVPITYPRQSHVPTPPQDTMTAPFNLPATSTRVQPPAMLAFAENQEESTFGDSRW